MMKCHRWLISLKTVRRELSSRHFYIDITDSRVRVRHALIFVRDGRKTEETKKEKKREEEDKEKILSSV